MEKVRDFLVDVWEDCYKHKERLPLVEICEQIKSEKFKESIDNIRRLNKIGDVDSANEEKRNLLSFTLSGMFDETKNRGKNNLIEYYGLMGIDIDKLENEEKVKEIFSKVISLEETLMAFVSPSGLGIKFIVSTNNRNSQQHSTLYKQLVKHYENILEVNLDKNTCDLARLCFFSYDPNTYYNSNSKIFEFEDISNESSDFKKSKVNDVDDSEFELQMKCVFEFTSNKKSFEIGSRNDFTFLFSKNCCGFGLNQKEVVEYCIENFTENNYTVDEVLRTVKSGYKYNQSEFGKWKFKLNKLMREYNEIKTHTKIIKQETSSEVSIKDFYINKVVESLPKDLMDIVVNLESEKEKDAFLVGILSSVEILFKNQSLK